MASRVEPRFSETGKSLLMLGGALGGALVILQALVDRGVITSTFIPGPSEVMTSVPSAVLGSLGPLEETLGTILIAFLASVAVGIPVGLAMGSMGRVGSVGSTYVSVLLSTPKIIFLPMMILWLGLGLLTTVTFTMLEASLPIMLLLAGAVRDFDRNAIRTARSLGASSSFQLQTKVVLPAMAPTIFSAARIGFLFSTVGVLVSQMFIGFGGIGSVLADDAYDLRIAQLYATALFLAAVVVMILLAMSLVFHRVFGKWQTPLPRGA